MERKEVFAYVKEQYGIDPDYPWGRKPHSDNAVLRHRAGGKWFGLIMDVPKIKLGLNEEGSATVLNVKCDPIARMALLDRSGVQPGYHMNKEHWISVILGGGLSEEEVFKVIDQSYALTH